MGRIPQSTITAMIKARKPPMCQACKGTNIMEDGPPGATYSAPCTYCQNGVPNWAFTEAECMLKAALEEGGVVLGSQYRNLGQQAEGVVRAVVAELTVLREAAQAFLGVAPISRGSAATDYSDARIRLRQELER